MIQVNKGDYRDEREFLKKPREIGVFNLFEVVITELTQ